jgi:hypothetical protein
MVVMSAVRSGCPLRLLRRLRSRGIALKLRKRRLRSLKIARLQRCTDRLEILRQRAVLIRQNTRRRRRILRQRTIRFLGPRKVARL